MNDSMLKPSNETLKIGTMFQLSIYDVHMARLIATGCTSSEAYAFTHDIEEGVSDALIRVRASRYMEDHVTIAECARWLNTSKIRADLSHLDDDSSKNGKKKKGGRNLVVNLRDKDSVIDALQEQIAATSDPKLRTDIIMKAADLQRMKQDENKDESKLIHFYLPLRCQDCSLYVKSKNKNGNHE